MAAGDNPGRLHSEAAFSMLCGASPIPASSGKTVRHRLNRGGNRQANTALYRIVVVRLRWHQPTRAYMTRRTKEGLSKREIIRCLKRCGPRDLRRLTPTRCPSRRHLTIYKSVTAEAVVQTRPPTQGYWSPLAYGNDARGGIRPARLRQPRNTTISVFLPER